MFVVSENYRDRGNLARWLVRRQDQHPHEALAFKCVACRGVRFDTSVHSEEHGYGCHVVAVAEEAVGQDDHEPESLASVLQFNGEWDFFETGTKSRVTDRDLTQLNLHSNGQITAVLKPLQSAVAEPAAEPAAV